MEVIRGVKAPMILRKVETRPGQIQTQIQDYLLKRIRSANSVISIYSLASQFCPLSTCSRCLYQA